MFMHQHDEDSSGELASPARQASADGASDGARKAASGEGAGGWREMMAEDGIRPSISLCHRMFGVWAGNGQIEDFDFEYDGGNSSSRLFERSRIRALAGENTSHY